MADVGFVGSDKLDEAALGGRWQNIARLTIADAGCALVAASPQNSEVVTVLDRVATSYPSLASEWFDERFAALSQRPTITYVPSGSVEAYVELGVADVIVDIRETGKSLVENGFGFVEEIRPITTELVWRNPAKQPVGVTTNLR